MTDPRLTAEAIERLGSWAAESILDVMADSWTADADDPAMEVPRTILALIEERERNTNPETGDVCWGCVQYLGKMKTQRHNELAAQDDVIAELRAENERLRRVAEIAPVCSQASPGEDYCRAEGCRWCDALKASKP